MNSMTRLHWTFSGSKGVTRKTDGGRLVIVEAKTGKATPNIGQKARVAALRQDRTDRVKQALSTASSHSTLFKSAG